MPRGTNQKLKLLYLMKILLENTDENHGMTLQEILSKLEEQEITAERKSLYNDFEMLRKYGVDVIGEQQDKIYVYKVVSREFELAELKLLVDSVQAARFITEKKSKELIKKIESFVSKYEASQLHRQVYLTQRNKTLNENIYYNVDSIHQAIGENVKIRFQYFQWNVKKEMELRHNGEFYVVSPWALSWDDEYYYLVAFDQKDSKLKHFRVDKILHIQLLEEAREITEEFRNFDLAAYAQKTFGMFHGEEQQVKLVCENRMAGVMIDRFGTEISMRPIDDTHFAARVKVAVSPQFFGWVVSLGDAVVIEGPESVVEAMKAEVERLSKQYGLLQT